MEPFVDAGIVIEPSPGGDLDISADRLILGERVHQRSLASDHPMCDAKITVSAKIQEKIVGTIQCLKEPRISLTSRLVG